MSHAVAVHFENLEDFIDDLVAEAQGDGVDGELVRIQPESIPVNSGMSKLRLRCGFLSNGEVREAHVDCGEVIVGGEDEMPTQMQECVERLKAVAVGNGIDVRSGRFELVVS